MKPVSFDGRLDDYLKAGDQIAALNLHKNVDALNILRAVHDYFTDSLWTDIAGEPPAACMLGFNAFTLFCGCARLALTGHANAVYPVLRTALESACYAFLVAKDEAIMTAWINREKDEMAKASCRKALRNAVGAVAARLDDLQTGSGRCVSALYEASIDWGAHPNALSVFGHTVVGEEGSDIHLRLVALYSPEETGSKRAMMACIDLGVTLAIVLTRARISAPAGHAEAVNDLIRERERFAAVAS